MNMVNITNASSSVLQTRGWVYVPLGSNGISKIQKSILTVHSGSMVVSLLQYLQQSHVIGFSFLETKDGYGHYFISTMTPRSISPSLCGAAHHGNLAKLITLSGSFCTLCHFLPELSPLSLSFYFLSRGFKARLCLLAGCLFGLLVWHRVLWEVLRLTHCLSCTLFPAHSLPPACPVQLNTHKGLNYEGQTELFWSQSNRKSMEEGFLFSERGR